MSLAQLSSPTAVKHAINESIRIGRDEFLRLYGFGRSREYPLLFDGQEFDSKAVAGVAHRYQFPELGALRSVEFSGGITDQGAARRLFELGYQIQGLHRRPKDWTLDESELAADAYFECLGQKLIGQRFNRTQALNRVATRIGRTRGSIDRKFQNIDAILLEADLPRLNDAIAKNKQGLLGFVVLDPLSVRLEVMSESQTVQRARPIVDVFVPPPHLPVLTDQAGPLITRAVRIDFAARDATNRSVGAKGEELVVQVEKERLTSAGRPDLVDKVEWVSRVRGDGLGYDIESFDDDGEPICIEVKATNQGQSAPFFLTCTELIVSEQMGERFRLYRVFNLSEDPRIYVLRGPLRDKLTLEARVFIGQPI